MRKWRNKSKKSEEAAEEPTKVSQEVEEPVQENVEETEVVEVPATDDTQKVEFNPVPWTVDIRDQFGNHLTQKELDGVVKQHLSEAREVVEIYCTEDQAKQIKKFGKYDNVRLTVA